MGGEGARVASQSALATHPGLHAAAHHPPPTPHLHVVQSLEAPPPMQPYHENLSRKVA